MSAWTKETEFLSGRRLVSFFLSLSLLLSCLAVFFPVKSFATEAFSFDNLKIRAQCGEVLSNTWHYTYEESSVASYSGSNQSMVRFGLFDTSVDSLAFIPVSADFSDIYIYSRFSVVSGVANPSSGNRVFLLRVRCYDANNVLLSTVVRKDYSEANTGYLAISGTEFALGTAFFTIDVGLGGDASGSTGSMYGLWGNYSVECSFTVVTGNGAYISDNWGTDNPYPFVFSHENQNIYLEKDGRIDFFVACRGFNELSMHVVARTYADTTKFDLTYAGSLNYALLTAVPPDTDEAAILCFDFYIQGNFVYTAPACAIYFSGWTGGGESGGGGSGGDIADGELLDYLEEVKLSQEQATEKIAALQTAMDELPNKIETSMENALDEEKTEANSTGSDLVGQLTEVIPNYSEGFATALGNFASNFSYEGTDAILTIPQVRFPEIPGIAGGIPLVKSFIVMDETEIDFSEFADMIPEPLLILVRCLLTAALIIFCGKELYDTISYVLTLRKGE